MERKDSELLANIKAKLPELKGLLAQANFLYVDAIYRFYHHSFKIFNLQEFTIEIVNTLRELGPEKSKYTKLNEDFMSIYHEGVGKTFSNFDNQRWLYSTRPIVEAFTHAKYFLEMAIRSAEELEIAPNSLPSMWAGVLYLYDMR